MDKIIKYVKDFLKRSSLAMRFHNYLFIHKYKRLYKKSPRFAAEEFFKYTHAGKQVNLDNPHTLEEKTIWLALNTDTSLWSRCTDKYAVRGYLVEHGAGDILNEFYGKWDNANEIDFEKLPNQFVIKSNNGCQTVLIVKDKSNLNIPKIKKKLNSWLNSEYGYKGYNWHYIRIKPCLIAEKYLDDHSSNGFPTDYKCFCVNGDVKCIVVYNERVFEGHHYKATVYDTCWNVLHESKVESSNLVPKPKTLQQMVDVCRKLTSDFLFVRTDFYEIDGKLIFGELTFTPETVNLTDDFNDKLGKLIDLSKINNLKNE